MFLIRFRFFNISTMLLKASLDIAFFMLEGRELIFLNLKFILQCLIIYVEAFHFILSSDLNYFFSVLPIILIAPSTLLFQFIWLIVPVIYHFSIL